MWSSFWRSCRSSAALAWISRYSIRTPAAWIVVSSARSVPSLLRGLDTIPMLTRTSLVAHIMSRTTSMRYTAVCNASLRRKMYSHFEYKLLLSIVIFCSVPFLSATPAMCVRVCVWVSVLRQTLFELSCILVFLIRRVCSEIRESTCMCQHVCFCLRWRFEMDNGVMDVSVGDGV